LRHPGELVERPVLEVPIDGDLRVAQRTNEYRALGPGEHRFGRESRGCQRHRRNGPLEATPRVLHRSLLLGMLPHRMKGAHVVAYRSVRNRLAPSTRKHGMGRFSQRESTKEAKARNPKKQGGAKRTKVPSGRRRGDQI